MVVDSVTTVVVQALSHVWLWPHGLQHTRLPCPSLSARVCSNSSIECVGDAIQPSHPLPSSSPFAFNLYQHQGLFQRVGSLHKVGVSASTSVLPMNIQELISFKIDKFELLAVQGTQESFLATKFKSINYLALSLIYGPILTSVLDYWKNYSSDYMDHSWQREVSAF